MDKHHVEKKKIKLKRATEYDDYSNIRIIVGGCRLL
jgi:hypothetical protein